MAASTTSAAPGGRRRARRGAGADPDRPPQPELGQLADDDRGARAADPGRLDGQLRAARRLAVIAPEAAVVVAHPRLDQQALGDRERPGGVAAEQGVGAPSGRLVAGGRARRARTIAASPARGSRLSCPGMSGSALRSTDPRAPTPARRGRRRRAARRGRADPRGDRRLGDRDPPAGAEPARRRRPARPGGPRRGGARGGGGDDSRSADAISDLRTAGDEAREPARGRLEALERRLAAVEAARRRPDLSLR